MLKRLLQPILQYTILTALSPIFLLLALMYVILHPNRVDDYGAVVRDFRSLAGMKSGDQAKGENGLRKTA